MSGQSRGTSVGGEERFFNSACGCKRNTGRYALGCVWLVGASGAFDAKDVGHARKDQSNRRSHLPGYAAWEIHPVMKLHVVQVDAGAISDFYLAKLRGIS
jgi:hypothetical protein